MYASKKWLGLMSVLLIAVLIATGCGRPKPGEGTPEPAAQASTAATASKGWSLIPTKITNSGGVLHVDLTARNDSGAWSAMAADDPKDKPTTLTTKDGKSVPCDTVIVSTSGHYLPPDFQIRGFTLKDKTVQTLYVECKADAQAVGSRLSIPYSFVTGEYDYYAQDKTKVAATLDVDLEQAPPTLTYPVTAATEKVHTLSEPITVLNKCTFTNTAYNRTGDTMSFGWKVENPGDYDTKVHIGNPPVLGSDGIIYGYRVSPDIVEVEAAPPKGAIEYKTEDTVPADLQNPYLLLSIEQSRERRFANFLIDLSQK